MALAVVPHGSGHGGTEAAWSSATDAEPEIPAHDGGDSRGKLQQEQLSPVPALSPPKPPPLPSLDALPHLFVSFGNAAYFDLANNWARSVQALGVPHIIAGKGRPTAAEQGRGRPGRSPPELRSAVAILTHTQPSLLLRHPCKAELRRP